MRKIIRAVLTLLWITGLLGATGCSNDKEACEPAPDVSNITVKADYKSLSDSLVHFRSKDELSQFLDRYPVFRDYFLDRGSFGDDSTFLTAWFNRFSHPAVDTLEQEVRQVFGDESGLQKAFTDAFKNMKYYYPEFRPPAIRTVITGLEGRDFMMSDSLIIMSLDFYAGPGARYRPQVYDYILKQYVPELVVPSCIMVYGIHEPYNAADFSDHTMLAEMIAYGKSFVFAKHMLPCVPDSVFLWYSAAEMKFAKAHEDVIWSSMISNQVLFTTDHITKEHYIGPRPATLEVAQKCPGRIAQWVGWQIVKSFIRSHPEISLQDLMKMTNANKLFKESGYKPVH